MKDIAPIFKKTTRQIARELDKIATKHGKESWLFLPKEIENKVCLVAHIDTVWDVPSWNSKEHFVPKGKKNIFYDSKQRVLWSPDGLGGDDRAGVFNCLNSFYTVPEPYTPIVLLTDKEETRGDGAYDALDEFGDILEKNTTMFVELDRRGKGEAVFYNDEPDDFIKYIESFGFKEQFGTFSDISILCDFLGICGTNLSMGYYNEHTKYEYLNLVDMQYTTDRIFSILRDNHERQVLWDLPIDRPKDTLADDKYFNYWEDDLCPNCHGYLTKKDIEMNVCTDCGAYIKEAQEEWREHRR